MRHWYILPYLTLFGCAPTGPSANSANTDTQTIRQLQSRLDGLESRLHSLSLEITDDSYRINLIESQWTTADFDPTDSSYQRIDAKPGIGSFAVSVQDVQPFGDGVRVRLNLGNPSSAIVAGVGLKLQYGPRAPESSDTNYAADYTAWSRSLQTKEESLTAELQPGAWNPVSVTLPKIDAKKFGYLGVSISNKSVSLAKR